MPFFSECECHCDADAVSLCAEVEVSLEAEGRPSSDASVLKAESPETLGHGSSLLRSEEERKVSKAEAGGVYGPSRRSPVCDGDSIGLKVQTAKSTS